MASMHKKIPSLDNRKMQIKGIVTYFVPPE